MAARDICKPQSFSALSIYGYTDYRTYLKDYYEFKKHSTRGYSYRAFSKAAGFSSPNILKLVIEGQRNIGAEAVDKFIRGLNLGPAMGEYFRNLIAMNQAKSDEQKELHLRELKRLTPHAKKRELATEVHDYLSHWLYPVIREMIELADFRDDPYWISRRLHGKASVPQISQALQFLQKEGFIYKDDEGHWAAKDQMVITSDEIKNLAIRNYHRQMLQQAENSLETLNLSDREFGALTLTLPEEALEALKAKLKSFRKDLHTWAIQTASDAGHDAVVQVNFQMYPHTRSLREGRNEN